MAELTRAQIKVIEDAMAFPRGFGYVLDFSDRTISEFFTDEFGIDIDDGQYAVNGTSKRSRLTAFLATADDYTAAKVLRTLWDRREGLIARSDAGIDQAEEEHTKTSFLEVIAKVEAGSSRPKSDGVDTFERDLTLEELVADIERTLAANKSEVAVDHLHTYCVKKITHLLQIRGQVCSHDEPLHSRFGRYRKALLEERSVHEFTDRALKSAISLLESFNDIRNNRSLAHDNKMLGRAEARLVIESVNAILVFVRAIEAGRYSTEQ